MKRKWTMTMLSALCAVALGCGGEKESGQTTGPGPSSGGQADAAPGAETGGVDDGSDGSPDSAAKTPGIDADALHSCLFSLEGAIPYDDSIDDSSLQRRLLAEGQVAYAVRPETEDDKQTHFSVYIFASAEEAKAEHERRLETPQDEFMPEAGNVGDNDLLIGPLLMSDAGNEDGLFAKEAAECARGAQR